MTHFTLTALRWRASASRYLPRFTSRFMPRLLVRGLACRRPRAGGGPTGARRRRDRPVEGVLPHHAVGARRIHAAAGQAVAARPRRRPRASSPLRGRAGSAGTSVAVPAADRDRRQEALLLRQGPQAGHRPPGRRRHQRHACGGAVRRRRPGQRLHAQGRGRARRPAVGGGPAQGRRQRLRPDPDRHARRPACRRWKCRMRSARSTGSRSRASAATPPCPDSDFSFTPPPGVDVIQLSLPARRRRSMADLFRILPTAPLAEALRPATLDEVIGQSHLIGPGKPLRLAFESGKPHSMILWGPPGVGKTTLARLTASAFGYDFIALSAVLSGVKDIRAVDGAGRAQPCRRAQDDPVHRRDPPLQQEPAGRAAAVRRIRAWSPSSAPPPRTRRSRSTRPCCRGRRSTCCRRWATTNCATLVAARA